MYIDVKTGVDTVTELVYRCPSSKHIMLYRVPSEDLIVLNQYPNHKVEHRTSDAPSMADKPGKGSS